MALGLSGCSDSNRSSVTGEGKPKPPPPEDPCPQPLASSLQVRINEVMIENVFTLPDANGEFFPWVEFYNPGPEAVDLGGAYFSDTIGDNQKWVFPCQFQETIPRGVSQCEEKGSCNPYSASSSYCPRHEAHSPGRSVDMDVRTLSVRTYTSSTAIKITTCLFEDIMALTSLQRNTSAHCTDTL